MKCFLILVPLFIYVSDSIAKDHDAPLTLAFVERQALDSSFKTKTVNAELEAAQNKAEAQHVGASSKRGHFHHCISPMGTT